jgi:hypothetical protein
MLRISYLIDNQHIDGSKVVSLTPRLRSILQKDYLVLIFVRGPVNPRTIVRLEGYTLIFVINRLRPLPIKQTQSQILKHTVH